MSLDIARIDTICALASASGYGAIAIVRASGPQAENIFRAVFRRKTEITPLVAMHGDIINRHGEVIDDVMAVLYPATKSFTGEPSCEIFCHGNQIIVEEIVSELINHGARLAEPGEFSMRAMLNGKIDLAQAESIADLIHAKSAVAKKIALRGVQGGLQEKTADLREAIISLLAEIEARMDFPDEDLGSYDKTHLFDVIDRAIETLSALLKNAHQGLRLHEGARIVICGLPNAGKSTLLNRLCGEDRAIVHETAGTTRDVIEAHIILGGIPIVLVDVAGIREVHDAIEKIGIERARAELARAHVVIWLADCTAHDPFGDVIINEALATIDAPIIKVLNKAELSKKPNAGFAISAKLGNGVNDLKSELAKILGGVADASEIFITRARQKEELEIALKSFSHAREALALGLVDEVIASELRNAGLAFDRLFGTELSEDILDRIFSSFVSENSVKKLTKIRLDHLLVELGLVENPSKARARIMAGDVIVNDHRVDKPGEKFVKDVSIRLRNNSQPYVSRGGLKLEHALSSWPCHLKGATAMDVGASTGGFTEVLLTYGAERVYAIDVGYGQIAEKLRVDARVINWERTHILEVTRDRFAHVPTVAVIDVSFISLEKILPHVVSLLADDAVIYALIKPQFEAGREQVLKGGIIKDPAVHAMVVEKIKTLAHNLGLVVLGVDKSPILGAKGNTEFLMAMKKINTQQAMRV